MAGNVTLDVPRTRFVVVHYHIFKNGGSTIESILRREFGTGFTMLHGPGPNSILSGDDLGAFLRDYEVSAISSHHLRYPLPALPRTVIFDCCFLRHPLDRLVSVYTYYRGIDSPDPLCRRACRQTARDFMSQTLQESPNMVSNVQVTQLANAGAFTRPANENDLECATQVFRNMAIPGLVDLFDESLVAAEYFVRPAFPGIRFDHTPHNVSREAGLARPARFHKLEDDLVELWGANLYADVTRLNEFDLKLYQSAQSEIRRRLFLIPGLDDKLVNFQARCARLAARPAVTHAATGVTRPLQVQTL
jgi:hypothetical protein